VADQTATTEFFLKGEPIKSSDRFEVKNLGGGKHQLIINSLQLDDVGEVKCRSGKLKSTCQLTIVKGEVKPEINLEGPVEGPTGKPLIMDVPYTIDGARKSPVEAKLFKDGKALTPKDGLETVVQDDKVVFKFKKTSRPMSGKYQIKLSNAQGETSKEVYINIQDVPNAPESVDVQEIFQTSCLLKWKKPKDDGGAALIKYIVERQDLSFKGGWPPVGEVTADQLQMRCEDLINKKEYKFRVIAVNKMGNSEPANFPKTVLAKDPWDEPGKPGNAEVIDWNKDYADLKWTKPENDGGSPITGYVIEYKEKFGKDWVTAKELSGDATAAHVDGLQEGTQYEFRIRAVNKAGPGEPSDATKPIICKSRFVKPYIIGDDLKPLVIKRGQVIKYDIKYGGEPEPEVVWMLENKAIKIDGERIPNTDVIRISVDKYERNTVLSVRKAVRADSGKYKLVLTNSSGTCEGVADVVVLDKPSRPQGPIVADEIRADHIKIKWKKPEDAGGSPVTGYVVE